MSFSPYLFFSDGRCREAFTFYNQVFGGELQVMTNSERPAGSDPMPGADPTHVMHASLTLDGQAIMGSDDPTGDGGPKAGFAVSYTAADDGTANKVFDALAEGGEVTMPMEPTFWASAFGMCTDRFGVAWMVDAAEQPAG